MMIVKILALKKYRGSILFMFLSLIASLCVIVHEAMRVGYRKSYLLHAAASEEEQLISYMNSGLSLLLVIIVSGSFAMLYNVFRDSYALIEKMDRKIRAFDASRDGVAIISDGVYTYINKAHANIFGYEDREYLIDRPWTTIFESNEQKQFELQILPALNREQTWFGESFGLNQSGQKFPIEINLSLLDNGDIICITRDISEKRAREQTLRIIKYAIEAAHDGIAIADANNKFVFMNKSYLRIHGYDPALRDDYIGTDWRDIYNERGRTQINQLVLPTTTLRGAWSGIIDIMRKDGTIFKADASLTRLHDGLVLGVIRDIHERHEKQREAEALKDQLFHTEKLESILKISTSIAADFEALLKEIAQSAAELKQEKSGNVHTLESILNRTETARELAGRLSSFASENREAARG